MFIKNLIKLMKNKKTAALLMALLMLYSAVFIVPVALSSTIPLPENSGLPNPTDTTGQGPVVQVIGNVLSWILTVFLFLAVIGFIVTGIQYLMSFGSSFAVEKAKRNFVYSVIAVAVVGGAMVIIYTIESLLSSP